MENPNLTTVTEELEILKSEKAQRVPIISSLVLGDQKSQAMVGDRLVFFEVKKRRRDGFAIIKFYQHFCTPFLWFELKGEINDMIDPLDPLATFTKESPMENREVNDGFDFQLVRVDSKVFSFSLKKYYRKFMPRLLVPRVKNFEIFNMKLTTFSLMKVLKAPNSETVTFYDCKVPFQTFKIDRLNSFYRPEVPLKRLNFVDMVPIGAETNIFFLIMNICGKLQQSSFASSGLKCIFVIDYPTGNLGKLLDFELLVKGSVKVDSYLSTGKMIITVKI